MQTASGTYALKIAVLAVLSMALGTKAHADDYRKLSGAEIKRLIAGKVVTDEVHYTDHFRINGVYEGVFMNKRSAGTWGVKGAELCYHPRIGRGKLRRNLAVGREVSAAQNRPIQCEGHHPRLTGTRRGTPPKNKTTNKGD